MRLEAANGKMIRHKINSHSIERKCSQIEFSTLNRLPMSKANELQFLHRNDFIAESHEGEIFQSRGKVAEIAASSTER